MPKTTTSKCLHKKEEVLGAQSADIITPVPVDLYISDLLVQVCKDKSDQKVCQKDNNSRPMHFVMTASTNDGHRHCHLPSHASYIQTLQSDMQADCSQAKMKLRQDIPKAGITVFPSPPATAQASQKDYSL